MEATPLAPALFTARTVSDGDILVTFGDPVTGTTHAEDWLVNTAPVAIVSPQSPAFSTLELRVAEDSPFGTGATPRVAYVPAGGRELIDVGAQEAMTPVAGSAGRSWTHSFVIGAGEADGPLSFVITAEDTDDDPNRATLTQHDITAASLPAIDRTPPSAVTARFAGPEAIEVIFREAVTAPPSGWEVRAASPGGAALAVASASIKAGAPNTVLLAVSAAEAGSGYFVMIPGTVADLAGNARAAPDSRPAVYARPGDIEALAVTVADAAGASFTDRAGAGAHLASLGDRVTISATFGVEVESGAGAPSITVGSDAGSVATPMSPVAGTAGRGWSHSFVVDAADEAGSLAFMVDARRAGDGVAVAATQADVLPGPNAEIDLEPPSAISARFAGPGSVEVIYQHDSYI